MTDLFSTQKKPSKYDEQFLHAYNQLNDEQKAAVDKIEGPILVNAGPGTGKTQILATRIGKILSETDTAPHNILCLTFTESATVAMRHRLIQFIGPAAHQVHIHTFHGFCNQVIQENLDIFGGYRQLEPLTDLERVDVFRELIDALPDDNPLKRFKYDRYFESRRMNHLFSLMKKENYTPEQLHAAIKEYLDDLPNRPEFIYKRKTTKKDGRVFVKGDVKVDDIKAQKQKLQELIAAIDQYENYIAIMDKLSRYDYLDMILWVLDEFNKNSALLSNYRERYLYFLVDEYQDTNGAQNELLDQLIAYWDEPNVFVVGDDDQAIYKFQGANLGNIKKFQEQYNPEVVVLKDNYRSNQGILNKAQDLITLNKERLVTKVDGLSKELRAAGAYKNDKNLPSISYYEKRPQECADIVRQLSALNQTAPDQLRNVAVIYRKHRQVEDIVTVLEKLGVPLNIKRRVNILKLPLVKNLINILSFLSEEINNYNDGQHRLFEILHYKYLGVDPLDVGKISMFCQKPIRIEKDTTNPEFTRKIYPKWREILSDRAILESLQLKNIDAILETNARFERWIAEVPISTLQILFETVINEGGILKHIMIQDDKAWLLQVITTFFDLIKNESSKNPELGLKEFLSLITKMNENDIELPISKNITSDKGVNFLTAHSAKGLEFQKVYMIDCTKKSWDGGGKFGGNQYSFPDTINADNKNNIEDERRLFYVAMTRAETELRLSYSKVNEDNKEMNASSFIEELRMDEGLDLHEPQVSEDQVANYYFKLLERVPIKVPLIEKSLIDNWLEGYKLSVTHLNKYLRCPVSFYFESILRVPSARNASTGFGTAMHHALNKYMEKLDQDKTIGVSLLHFHFEESMAKHRSHFTDEQYVNYTTHGKKVLTLLHEEKQESWKAIAEHHTEVELANAVYKGVPLKGFIDMVEVVDKRAKVIDYKTGKYRSEKLQPVSPKNELGGDYWRQIVFYKMLLDSDKKYGWQFDTGRIEFIEPDRKTGKIADKEYYITDEDIKVVGDQIVDSYAKIKAYEFDKTCEDPDCRWCNFAANNYVLSPEGLETEHSFDA